MIEGNKIATIAPMIHVPKEYKGFLEIYNLI